MMNLSALTQMKRATRGKFDAVNNYAITECFRASEIRSDCSYAALAALAN
jgi:hypothetical protein